MLSCTEGLYKSLTVWHLQSLTQQPIEMSYCVDFICTDGEIMQLKSSIASWSIYFECVPVHKHTHVIAFKLGFNVGKRSKIFT